MRRAVKNCLKTKLIFNDFLENKENQEVMGQVNLTGYGKAL